MKRASMVPMRSVRTNELQRMHKSHGDTIGMVRFIRTHELQPVYSQCITVLFRCASCAPMNYNYNPALTYEDYVRCAPCAPMNYN